MKRLFNAIQLVGLLAVLTCSQAFAQQKNELGWTMDSAIEQLEKQGREFDTALADVEIEWTNSDGSTDKNNSGRIYQNKNGDVRIHIKEPQERVILIKGRDVMLYDPGQATVQEFSRTKDNRLEPYTVLGFSYTGSDLKKDFLVTFLGEDEITNRRVLGLELTPKNDSDRAHVSTITLWIDQASWLPVRQIIEHTSSGQSVTATYSGTARNLKLNSDLFRDRWPKGTQKVRN
jgi:outer membrane lipoprotein-sorting protein